MKILIVINSLGIGGAESVVINLADKLSEMNHEVKIVYLSDIILIKPRNQNIELISLETNKNKDILLAYLKLKNVVNNFKPDVVHSHLFKANILSRLLKFSRNPPKIICTEHSTKVGGLRNLIGYRLTNSLADINTNVSDVAVESYIRKGVVSKGSMITIENGVDTSKFIFNPTIRKNIRDELSVSNKKIILAVGRLDTPKDYPNLLKAISILKKNRDDFTVFIVGDGPLKSSLMKLSNELGLKETIKFLGSRTNVKDLIQAADVYVMSSMWEGLPMVILEAMACERMVVATDCGGIKNLVGQNGLVVPTRNPSLLGSALETALDMSNEQRIRTGIRARQYIVDNYSLDHKAKAYLKLYSS
ncbi:glycosyltransferase [Psychrobacter sp. H7-1]|uniref:glycosyltransferase n=1 Tax=Psychrobacter sp. H7-1 TaxID=1569265 RepID=UPI00191A45C2|nr:glycosyltransferase [Psychrobacter sp. H7-1]